MLDPDSYQMNMDPQHCKTLHFCGVCGGGGFPVAHAQTEDKFLKLIFFLFFLGFREALTKQQKKRAPSSDFSPGSEDEGTESDE